MKAQDQRAAALAYKAARLDAQWTKLLQAFYAFDHGLQTATGQPGSPDPNDAAIAQHNTAILKDITLQCAYAVG